MIVYIGLIRKMGTNSILKPQRHYILERSIDKLHKESKEWISETEFRRIEFSFFKKMIQKQILQVRGLEKEQLERILKLSQSYTNELEELTEFLFEHERYLYNLIQNKAVYNDKVYREDHHALSVQIKDVDIRFKKYKKQLYVVLA